MIRTWLFPLAFLLAFLLACRPCEDNCREYVELSFVSASASGEFASPRYEFVLDADGEIASCEIDVATMLGEEQECQGEAVISISDGSSDESGTGDGGAAGARQIVVRWYFAPATFDLVVRDDVNTLVMSNTLTPAYQDQGMMACDGQCERFEREIVLPE
jgi:hypothetical protein